MMTNHRILSYVNGEPFRPFRINMASGKTYEIRHPEMIQVGRTTLTVFTWTNNDQGESKEREQEISLIIVESIEPLDSSVKQDFRPMMTSRTVGEYVSAEPFRPFRIKMASGGSFEIRHPEMILVGRTSVRVFIPSDENSGGGDLWQDVSLMLMETIEPMDASSVGPHSG